MQRAALYTRVSTPEQAREGYSLAAQEKVLRQYCEQHGFEVHELYSDEGISGKSLDNRHEMNRMMADVEKKLFDIIIVWKLTRLTRSLLDLCSICELLEDKGIALISYTESFDASTPAGRMMRGILGVIAQWEREVISENVKLGNMQRAESGRPMCAYILGYDRLDDELVINAREAEIVRFIFQSYLRLLNLHRVIGICEEMGFTGKLGKPLGTNAIHRLLSHSVYAGYHYHAGQVYRGHHEPIISVGMYNEVQCMLTRRSSGTKRRNPIIILPE
ncbi:MAG: recombinase family protein [Symbiobacteriaceae bacterium]|nr:recombinase family protein [Symbiobacteriaceae bacterium]